MRLRFIKYLGVSRKTLLEHKMRSFLTILGIIFGVAAVIAMTAIGEGAKEEALKSIQQMGIQNVFVNDIAHIRTSAHSKGRYVTDGILPSDIAFAKKLLPGVDQTASVKQKEFFIQTGTFQSTMPIKGVSLSYLDVMELSASDGRLFVRTDYDLNKKVCLLGPEAAARLFSRSRAVGSQVRFNGESFAVVGVLADRPGVASDILVPGHAPFLYEKTISFESPITTAIFHFRDTGAIQVSSQLLGDLFKRRHSELDDFELVVPEALLRQQERTQNIFNSIMLLITAISLLVGGIGIMNIMLASVMERTKEIGIRRGMGATQSDIQHQFLAEAVVLTSAGGVIGILVGVILTKIIAASTGWQTHIPISAIVIAFSFSVLIGVLFGYYPARNASELNPIDALRYE
ncbi:ABC transporter permease [Tichowtungia aerotolerans]|uniref:FtsX-like permease family protein n=1 Tax=Tichowtungia aerotolerans TaxID=2697043 RepID=A0A6P1M0P8_9BACT|nr:ABC transporter permease [Tichowtungia aerotolerans]QHI68130.1 FtsX-like permease family protein [Tichowtungia aerotolerans]